MNLKRSERNVAEYYKEKGYELYHTGVPDFLAIKRDENGIIISELLFIEVKNSTDFKKDNYGLREQQIIWKEVIEILQKLSYACDFPIKFHYRLINGEPPLGKVFKPKNGRRFFRCNNCGLPIIVPQNSDNYYSYPAECFEQQGGCTKTHNDFTEIDIDDYLKNNPKNIFILELMKLSDESLVNNNVKTIRIKKEKIK